MPRTFQERYLADPSLAMVEKLLALSQDWLRQHILGEDMNYKSYVKG